jgi:hypothetical protein
MSALLPKAAAALADRRVRFGPTAASCNATIGISRLRNVSLDKVLFCAANHTQERKFWYTSVTISDTEGTVLAEIFILRLEVIARISPDVIPVSGRFVPLNPAAPIEFKNKSNNRRS